MCEKTIPKPFSKTSKSIISHWIITVLYSFVFIVLQVEGNRKILDLSCRPLGFSWNKAFLKNKTIEPEESCKIRVAQTQLIAICFKI